MSITFVEQKNLTIYILNNMKKTFTIILSILLLASCINNDYKETQKLISEADNFDIKTLSKITSKISDSKYSKD